VLLYEAVEIFTLLLVFFILQCGLRLDRRVGQPVKITQLEAQSAIDIILKRGLRKQADRVGTHDREL
jgi:hypothetical protein